MKNIFAFCNQKGGVGKTTSAVNIGSALSKEGYKILIVDMDSQANATSGVGIDKQTLELTSYQLLVDKSDLAAVSKSTEQEGLDIIPSSTDLAGADLELVNADRREYALKEALQAGKEKYDFIFIDCPPSLGLTTINCLVAADYLFIPLQCEYYALEGLSQLLHTYQLVRDNLNQELDIGGVLLTMADFRTNLTQQVIEEVRNYFNDKVFETVIPRSVKLSEAPSFGKPAVLYDPASRGSQSYIKVAQEMINRFREKETREIEEIKQTLEQINEKNSENTTFSEQDKSSVKNPGAQQSASEHASENREGVNS